MEMVGVQWGAAPVKMDTMAWPVSTRIVQIHLSLWTLIRSMSNRGTIALNMVNVLKVLKIPSVNVKMNILDQIAVINDAKMIVPTQRRKFLESV